MGKDAVSSPQFSPAGTRIAFLSRRKFPEGIKGPEKEELGSQIWLLDLRGGEARPLTKIPFGVNSYEWVTEDHIYLAARERLSQRESAEKKSKDKSRVVEDERRFQDGARRLFRFEIPKKKLVRLSENEDQIGSFRISPDESFAIAMHNTSPSHRAEGNAPPRCQLHDLGSGKVTELFAERLNKPRSFHWRKDSSACYIQYPESSVDGENNATITLIKELRVPDLRMRDVELDWDRGAGGDFAVTDDGFLLALANGMRPKFRRYVRNGDSYVGSDVTGEGVGRLLAMTKARDDSRVVLVTGGASDPDHVMSSRLTGEELGKAVEIHRPNDGFKGLAIARTEIIRWKGALDEEVEGMLYYPHDYREGERRPLVLITHGGPHGADRDRFSERYANSPNMYCQRGAFVLKTNYHGSSSYGLAFGESIKGRYYELEIQDMFSGIQKLIDDGLVDRDQMGLVGWSNGAILSIAALTHAQDYAPGFDFEFKACAPGAGDVNWTSDYGNCAFGASFDDYYLGGAPWEMPDLYVAKSPLFRAGSVDTPTIIFFGTEDTSVPTEQGWQWYRALHKVGTPVRFLLFPGEPHGLRKLTHQRRKLEEELKWFDQYLFETEAKSQLPVRKGSLLDLALRMDGPAEHSGRFGVLRGELLLPETRPFQGEVAIGRFEVTRAQYRAFQRDYPVPAGTENHPAQGISAANARAYVAWLGEQTGDAWRLPTAAELSLLEKSKSSEENDLERWVGFKPSHQESAVLSQAVVALGWKEALWAVGTGSPSSRGLGEAEELFFDVSGNVAEWVVDGGSLAPHGVSAATLRDDRSDVSNPPAEFVGIRVAKGPLPGKDSSQNDR
ncbi:MAG: prolyl oligopeptidase family serine peptidase [Planctomycetota bacterium]